jgi:hypothetical protein
MTLYLTGLDRRTARRVPIQNTSTPWVLQRETEEISTTLFCKRAGYIKLEVHKLLICSLQKYCFIEVDEATSYKRAMQESHLRPLLSNLDKTLQTPIKIPPTAGTFIENSLKLFCCTLIDILA